MNEENERLLREEVWQLKRQVEKLQMEKKKILSTLQKVRKEKHRQPTEVSKITLLKADYQVQRGSYTEHWILPVAPEPELFYLAAEWVANDKYSKANAERIYYQPKTGWVVVVKQEKGG